MLCLSSISNRCALLSGLGHVPSTPSNILAKKSELSGSNLDSIKRLRKIKAHFAGVHYKLNCVNYFRNIIFVNNNIPPCSKPLCSQQSIALQDNKTNCSGICDPNNMSSIYINEQMVTNLTRASRQRASFGDPISEETACQVHLQYPLVHCI